MKQVKCENCQSVDFQNINGIQICKACGTTYSENNTTINIIYQQQPVQPQQQFQQPTPQFSQPNAPQMQSVTISPQNTTHSKPPRKQVPSLVIIAVTLLFMGLVLLLALGIPAWTSNQGSSQTQRISPTIANTHATTVSGGTRTFTVDIQTNDALSEINVRLRFTSADGIILNDLFLTAEDLQGGNTYMLTKVATTSEMQGATHFSFRIVDYTFA